MNRKRTLVNPVDNEEITFLKTSAETGGNYSDSELIVAAGAGKTPHYHRQFAEHFTVLDGTLGLQIGREQRRLRPGESCAVPVGVVHRFFNPGRTEVRFKLRLTPGHDGVENVVRIQYGLARDGQTNRKGVPRNPLVLALLFDMSGTYSPILHTVLAPLMNGLAWWARRRGLDERLLNRYCR